MVNTEARCPVCHPEVLTITSWLDTRIRSRAISRRSNLSRVQLTPGTSLRVSLRRGKQHDAANRGERRRMAKVIVVGRRTNS